MPAISATTCRLRRVLLVGSGMWPWYENACGESLRSLGCDVALVSWTDDFYRWGPDAVEPQYRSFVKRVENRLLVGPTLRRVNRRVLDTAATFQPDGIWFYNATHVFASTVRRLRGMLPDARLVQYANDNPFGGNARYWRHLHAAIPYFDCHFVYRLANLDHFRRAGARRVQLLRSYYIPHEDYRVALTHGDERFHGDVVFAGHYEADGRLQMLEGLAADGVRVNVFGGGWRAAPIGEGHPLRALCPIRPVVGEDYRKAISGASIALCFLSKLNADTYTRRNFQIPAMGTFMLSEYTDDLAGMFTEGVEAEYFRSPGELREKVAYYLAHAEERERIAARGRDRLIRDGHDIMARMREVVTALAS